MDSPQQFLKSLIRDIPNFPKPGVVFKDITPLIQSGHGFRTAIDLMAASAIDLQVDVVASPEARGFIFGPALAYHLGCGFVPVRKPGKLPHRTASIDYELEYGTDSIEMHSDGIGKGESVLLVDDVLATGGTMRACTQLVESLGGKVSACLFLIELSFLNGRQPLRPHRIEAVLTE